MHLPISSSKSCPSDSIILRSRRRFHGRSLVTNPLRPSNFVVPFPPALARCQAVAAAPSMSRRDASHRFCPPRGYPRFTGRCFLGTMRPSDSLHRVGPASRYACAVPTLAALRTVSGHRSVRCRHEHRFRHRQSDTRSRTAKGRCRASLGKPCDVPAKPPRTTARLAQILDIPFPSTVIQPTSPWVHFRCVPRFGSDFLSILRYARDTVVVASWFPLAGGPQRTCTASSHGMRGTIGRVSRPDAKKSRCPHAAGLLTRPTSWVPQGFIRLECEFRRRIRVPHL